MKKYEAMVLSCMDPRFQTKVFDYLRSKKLKGKYSSFTIAGAAIGVTHKKFKKWHSTFWDNLETSIKLHNISKLIVINHKDCGAAKIVNKCKIKSIEWLYLAAKGHRRAKFDLETNKNTWLVP